MKKLLIASAVSAAIAAPATALAQARVPTLSQVLDASGLNVNGYIDTSYQWANKDQTRFTDRVFDQHNNSFSLNQFGLTVAKQPKEGFGGLVNITAGQDAQFIHSFPEGTGIGTSMFDLTQAYGSYSSGALTLIGGKFTTLAGTEVIASSGNTTFSRSILFGAIPFTHTGVRASYAPSDTVTVYGGLNNGWDQLSDANRQKTLEIGATFATKALSVTASGYFGTDPVNPALGTPPNGERDLIDVVATFNLSNAASIGGEILTFRQDIPGGTTQKYNGLAMYFTYMLNSKWRGVVRGEWFDDKNGFHFGTPTGTKYYEATLCLSYLPTSSVELRTEVRMDKANNSVFIDSDGSTSKTLASLGLQGLYKF